MYFGRADYREKVDTWLKKKRFSGRIARRMAQPARNPPVYDVDEDGDTIETPDSDMYTFTSLKNDTITCVERVYGSDAALRLFSRIFLDWINKDDSVKWWDAFADFKVWIAGHGASMKSGGNPYQVLITRCHVR